MRHTPRRLLSTALALASLGLCAPLWAQPSPEPAPKEEPVQHSLEGGQVVAKRGGVVLGQAPAPCADPGALLVQAQRLYLACAQEGVAVLDVSDPAKMTFLGLKDAGGPATGLFTVQGEVWVQTQLTQARPLSQTRAAGPSEPSPQPSVVATAQPKEPTPAATAPEAPILERRVGEIVVALGTRAGLKRGDRVEVFTRRPVELGDGQTASHEERALVGTVTAASDDRAVVKLGLNERVPDGSLARPTKAEPTGDLLRPPRVDDVWEISANLRPFLALGSFGFGVLADGAVGRRMSNNLHVQLRLDPVGLGLADEGNVLAAGANLIASYDTELFEVGLGAGWSAVNDNLDGDAFITSSEDGAGGVTTEVDRVRSGLSIAQLVRLGAVDGINLTAYNTFIFYRDQFNYGGTTGQLQFPINDRTWILMRGGGGVAGYAFGEVGLRVLLQGNGDRGSLYLTPTLGGGGVFGETDCDGDDAYEQYVDQDGECFEEVSYAGPLVGLGVEWRR